MRGVRCVVGFLSDVPAPGQPARVPDLSGSGGRRQPVGSGLQLPPPNLNLRGRARACGRAALAAARTQAEASLDPRKVPAQRRVARSDFARTAGAARRKRCLCERLTFHRMDGRVAGVGARDWTVAGSETGHACSTARPWPSSGNDGNGRRTAGHGPTTPIKLRSSSSHQVKLTGAPARRDGTPTANATRPRNSGPLDSGSRGFPVPADRHARPRAAKRPCQMRSFASAWAHQRIPFLHSPDC
eukprot:365489-Chlamydomonas_euryale.AAC.5